MCSVDAFIAEDAIDGEVARGTRVRGKFVKHIGGDGGGVRSENEFERFTVIVGVAVANRAVFARFVDFFHIFEILLVVLLRLFL